MLALKQQGWISPDWNPLPDQSAGLERAAIRYQRDSSSPLLVHWVMGAGKTDFFFSLCCYLSSVYGHKTHLILAPTTVLREMEDKASRFFGPRVKTHLHVGPHRDEVLETVRLSRPDALVILCSVACIPPDLDCDTLIVDEAHLIKSAKRVQMVNSVRRKNEVLVTGTPVVHDRDDAVRLLSLTNLQPYNSPLYWRENPGDELRQVLERITDTVLDVERKYQVRRHTVLVPMLPEQMVQEDAILAAHRDDSRIGGFIRGNECKVNSLSPALYRRSRDWANSPSPKTEALMRQLQEFRDHKIVIVCGCIPYLSMLSERLGAPCIDHRVSDSKRKAIIDDFQRQGRILLLSKGMAIGLNLACATVIMLLDVSYTFVEEIQAEHRIMRADQKNEVHLVRFVATRDDGVVSSDRRCLLNQLQKTRNADQLLGTVWSRDPRFQLVQ